MTSHHFGNVLFVQSAGSHLSLDGAAIRCHTAGDDSWRRLPLARVESIVMIGAVAASSDLLLHCAEAGIPVHWLSEFGRPRATVLGPRMPGGGLRSAQHAARSDPAARTAIAAALVDAKAGNQLAVLRRAAKDATGHRRQGLRDATERISRVRETLTEARRLGTPNRQAVLGYEGVMSRFYFTGLRHALSPIDGIDVPKTRSSPPATDPVNSTMSFIYGLIRSAVHGAVHGAGLDPAAGFLHGDRDGQPSLVLDLMEEFRPGGDRVTWTLFNRRQLNAGHFERQVSGATHLTEHGRKTVLAAWHEHRLKEVKHHLFEHPVPNSVVPHVQARVMARLLSGDIDIYQGHRL